MTQDIIIELQKTGVKFEDYVDNEDAVKHSVAILERIVEDGQYGEQEINESNLRRVVSNPSLAADLINAATMLAQGDAEEDAGNLLPSSAGSSIPPAENTGSSSSAPTGTPN